MTSALFSPIRMRGLQLDNRIVVSPMCQYSAENGSASDWHLMHLGQFAVSGVGLIILESTHVEARGRITHGCLGLYSDENEAALKPVMAFCRKHGSAKIGIQLSHSGRKGSAKLPWEGRGFSLTKEEGAWETVAPSAIPYDAGWPAPRAMAATELAEVKEAHVDSVRRAQRIGFDLIEVHIAHGYLLHEFLSPLTNQRTDEYGGSLDNRLRYPLEVFAAMRAAWPEDKPMGVRLSALDWIEGGWTLDQTMEFARRLKQMGCDYLTVSTGGLSLKQVIPIGEGHQVEFSDAVRKGVDIPTMAVGMIYDPRHAESLISTGQADFVALARGMLFDPHWPWYAATVLGGEIKYPPQYIRGYRSPWHREMRASDSRNVSEPIERKEAKHVLAKK